MEQGDGREVEGDDRKKREAESSEEPSPDLDTQPGSAVDETAEPGTGAAPEPPQWWEDPRMPWKGKPTRADIWCWVGFSLTGVYSLVLLPLRPVLLGANPYLLAALGGSRTSAVTIGALAATGYGWWPLGLLLGTFGSVKYCFTSCSE